MEFEKFPNEFDPTRCVLFLGAGFSVGALNHFSESPPIGDALAEKLKKPTLLLPSDTSSLSDIANHAVTEKIDLFPTLENLYTIARTSSEQDSTLSMPWRRIYTTNYDNSVSVSKSKSQSLDLSKIYDITDNAPKRLDEGAVIHLHGSIAKCDPNPEKLDDCLVLTTRSYVQQRALKSVWWEWFERDVRTAQYMFFIGYDNNDFEPASYLIKHPDAEKNRHFILRNPESPTSVSKINGYGVRHSFELSGFVKLLSRGVVKKTPLHENQLDSFKFTDIQIDKKVITKPTSAEIQELFSFGKYRNRALYATAPASEYTVFRDNLYEEFHKKIEHYNAVIIHSKLGNGKSIFTAQVKFLLSKNGSNCFTLKKGLVPRNEEINFLRNQKNAVVFFTNYEDAFLNAHLFTNMPNSIRFVIEMPTRSLSIRFSEVSELFNSRASGLNVDKFYGKSASLFKKLLLDTGLTSYLTLSVFQSKSFEVRDFLIQAYELPEVSKRIEELIKPLLSDYNTKKIIIICSILEVCEAEISEEFVASVIDRNPYNILDKCDESILEILEYSIDEIKPHSSILSKHILSKYIDNQEYLDSIYDIAVEAARQVDEIRAVSMSSSRFRRSRAILTLMIKYSNLRNILGQGGQTHNKIVRFYEKCRRDELISQEPLFWLQYSIAWRDYGRWDFAENYVNEAYVRGQKRPFFKTYQIDTYYLSLLCDLEINIGDIDRIGRFEQLRDTIKICRELINDRSHGDHIIKAFSKIEQFVTIRGHLFNNGEAVAMIYEIRLVISRLDSIPSEEKIFFSSEDCKQSLERAIHKILKLDVNK